MEGFWFVDVFFWMNKFVVDGNLQSEVLLLEMRKDLSRVGFWFYCGGLVFLYVKELVRRNLVLVVIWSIVVGLFFVLIECFVQVVCSGVEVLEWDWFGGGFRVIDGYRGQCFKGEFWVL